MLLSLVTALGAASSALAIPGSPVLSRTAPDLIQCLAQPLSYSCENTTAVNTCCLSTEGLILQAQFWDTYTGYESAGQILPKNTWTIHGLWSDHCDGSYDGYCDLSRQYDPNPSPTTINGVTVPPWTGETVDVWIKKFGRQDLLDYMNTYWVSQGSPNTAFWAHEFSKHATCFSTYDTTCWNNYKEHEEVINFYDTVIQAYRQFPTFEFLKRKGIVPSNTTTYDRADIIDALTEATGATPYVGCTKAGAFDEVWYYTHSYGPPQLGIFKHVNTTSSSSCPETGVWYYERTPTSERDV